MARPRSAHVHQVKAALAARLGSGLASPGGKFLSTRAVARRFEVSYQTAHRLLAELASEGALRREPASGSFIPGESRLFDGVQLVFDRRARRKESFGANLRGILEAALAERGIATVCSYADGDKVPRLRQDLYPVFWECRAGVRAVAAARRFSLCLNDTPPAGLNGGFVDAITTDDFSGGACAAELLKARTGLSSGFSILGGPADDVRCQQRIAGFRTQVSGARVVFAGSWFVEDGRDHVEEILSAKPAAIFACNDRLAEALLGQATGRRGPLPPVVGFDNAPVAERLRLTTIGIPWEIMADHAVEVVETRLGGNSTPAKLITLPHEPIVRMTA